MSSNEPSDYYDEYYDPDQLDYEAEDDYVEDDYQDVVDWIQVGADTELVREPYEQNYSIDTNPTNVPADGPHWA